MNRHTSYFHFVSNRQNRHVLSQRKSRKIFSCFSISPMSRVLTEHRYDFISIYISLWDEPFCINREYIPIIVSEIDNVICEWVWVKASKTHHTRVQFDLRNKNYRFIVERRPSPGSRNRLAPVWNSRASSAGADTDRKMARQSSNPTDTGTTNPWAAAVKPTSRTTKQRSPRAKQSSPRAKQASPRAKWKSTGSNRQTSRKIARRRVSETKWSRDETMIKNDYLMVAKMTKG